MKTAKECILEVLHFEPKFTTEIYMELINKNISIGVHSLTNRLQELVIEVQIIGEKVEGHKEKRWRILEKDKKGNLVLFLK